MSLALVAFVLAAGLAVTDWIGVATGRANLRLVGKPGTMVALIVAALAIEPFSSTARTWFVVGLVLSLAGDVLLMLEQWFLAGLGAFLLAHVAYAVGLAQWPDWPVVGWVIVGILVVALAAGLVGEPLRSAVHDAEPGMVLPVLGYIAVISLMVVAAFATGDLLPIVAALLFYASDALLGWNRFRQPLAWGPLAVMVTYHLAQGLFVVSLIE